MFSSGTRASVKKISVVPRLRRTMVFSLRMSTPGVSFGTRIRLMPRCRSASVRASTVITVPGRCAPEHQVLLPLRTQSPSSSTALVLIEAASDPASGSEIETLNFRSPARKPGRYFSFCASVPWWAMLVAVNIEVITAAAKSRL